MKPKWWRAFFFLLYYSVWPSLCFWSCFLNSECTQVRHTFFGKKVKLSSLVETFHVILWRTCLYVVFEVLIFLWSKSVSMATGSVVSNCWSVACTVMMDFEKTMEDPGNEIWIFIPWFRIFDDISLGSESENQDASSLPRINSSGLRCQGQAKRWPEIPWSQKRVVRRSNTGVYIDDLLRNVSHRLTKWFYSGPLWGPTMISTVMDQEIILELFRDSFAWIVEKLPQRS